MGHRLLQPLGDDLDPRPVLLEPPEQGIVGISGIDTRALVRHLREGGAINGAISTDGSTPAQLLEQLTEPHWQAHLSMRALVTVVDGSRLHDSEWSRQNLYADQLKAAQIIAVSHADRMNAADAQALAALQAEYQPYQQAWLQAAMGQLDLAAVDIA